MSSPHGGQYTTTFSDTSVTLSEGKAYYYRVRACNNNGYSYSGEASVTIPLNPPSDLKASAISSSEIRLSWIDNSSAEDGFKIERKTGGEGYKEIASVGPNVTSYTDRGLNPSTTYYYRIRAFNSLGGDSVYSNEAGATTPSSGGGGGCFIATAAYGSYLAPEVQVLRGFRDRYLMTNPAGRRFVELYYRISPPLARFISEHEALKVIARVLLTPVVYGIKYPLFVILAVLGTIITIRKRRYFLNRASGFLYSSLRGRNRGV